MYIAYKDKKYPCNASVSVTTMRYWNLPEDFSAPVDGEIILCADDGFELRRDNSADYLRQTFANGMLTLTNEPEPVPVEPEEPVEPEPTADDVLNALLGVTE
jgi:hypothetical protein